MNFLERTRRELELTQAQLAEKASEILSRKSGYKVSVSGSTVSAWETEKSLPGPLVIAAVAEALGLSPGKLTSEIEKMLAA